MRDKLNADPLVPNRMQQKILAVRKPRNVEGNLHPAEVGGAQPQKTHIEEEVIERNLK